MRALHQLVATLAPYDAVSDEARAIQAALRARGVRSELFAEHVAPGGGETARPLDELGAVDGDPVLLHYSIASAVLDRAAAVPGPLVVRYHNVTPPHWFRGVNDDIADLCRRGQAELPRLAAVTRVALADSAFNARDLHEAGYPAVHVVPLLLPPPPAPAPPVARDPDHPVVVTVGRVAPNKRIDEVLRTFALFQRACRPGARLVVVGSDEGVEPYGRACRALAGRLRLHDVEWAGRVDEAAKHRLYAGASAYLCLSEHEGFCVPLVEAMRHDVPVLARPFGAVPETLGRSGLAVDADHAELAELLERVVADADLRARVVAAQRAELARFEAPTVLARMLGVIGRALERP